MTDLVTFISMFLTLYCVYQLGSLAGIFSERAGVANIAIEGNMIVGAVLFAILFENLHITMSTAESVILAMLITVPLAATYMLLLSILTNRYLADHVVAGTGMNLLAPAIMIMLYYIFNGVTSGGDLRPSYINLDLTDWIMHLNLNGKINNDFNYIYLLFLLLTIIIVIVSAFFLNKTKFGLRLKSSGENPYALETAGVSVARTRIIALYIAGLLSALAGIVFVSKGTFFFTVNGSGFLAIGIMILGQYRISGTIIGSIIMAAFIGFFDTLPLILGTGSSVINKTTNIFKMIPFLIPIIGLMIFKKSYSPKAIGKNFKKDQR